MLTIMALSNAMRSINTPNVCHLPKFFILSDVTQSGIMPHVVIPRVVIFNVVRLWGVILSVVILNVLAPFVLHRRRGLHNNKKTFSLFPFSSGGTFFSSSCFQLAPLFLFFLLSIHLFRRYFFWKKCARAVWQTKPKQNKQNVRKGSCSDVRTKNFTGNFSKLGPMLLKIVCNKLRCLTSVWHTKPKTKQTEMLKEVPALMSGQKISAGIFQNLGPML